MVMTELEKYTFETNGVVVKRGLFNAVEIEKLKTQISIENNEKGLYFEQVPDFAMEFMTHPWIMDCCAHLLGPWFRFDHELMVQQTIKSEAYLHGGQYGSHGTCFHHSVERSSWNGQLTVGLAMTFQSLSTGGFAYVPGSQSYAGAGQFAFNRQVQWNEMLNNNHLCHTPTLNVGDVYVFSESLAHGQKQWLVDEESRKTLYIKFVPGYMAWQNPAMNEGYKKLAKTPQQISLFEPPYVRNGPSGSNNYRKPSRSSR